MTTQTRHTAAGCSELLGCRVELYNWRVNECSTKRNQWDSGVLIALVGDVGTIRFDDGQEEGWHKGYWRLLATSPEEGR